MRAIVVRSIESASARRTRGSSIAGASIETADELIFDPPPAALRARRRRRFGALVLAEQNLPADDMAATARISHRGKTDGRFAGPGFANEADDLASLELKGHVVDQRRSRNHLAGE